MSQQFQVLKCFKCSTYQVHPVKKSIRWVCKICGEKQSVRRNYGTGSGKDCRHHVQTLNTLRGQQDEAVEHHALDEHDVSISIATNTGNNESDKNTSKWSQYVEPEDKQIISIVDDSLEGVKVVLELPKKKPRKRTKHGETNCPSYLEATTEMANVADVSESIHLSKITEIEIKENDRISQPNIANVDIKTQPDSCPEQMPNNVTKTFYKYPKISRTSKWAQFVEDDEKRHENVNDFEDTESEINLEDEADDAERNIRRQLKLENYVRPTSRNIISFSQCNDEDLDEVLNI